MADSLPSPSDITVPSSTGARPWCAGSGPTQGEGEVEVRVGGADGVGRGGFTGDRDGQDLAADVVGVLVEVPVMLSVCRVCNDSRAWYARALPPAAP